MRGIAIYLAMLAGSCVARADSSPKPLKLAPDYPRAILQIVAIAAPLPDGRVVYGHGTPVGPRLLVTIGHLADAGALRTDDGRPLAQLARGEGDVPTWYRNDGRPFDQWVQVSAKPLMIGQRVYWSVFLDAQRSTGYASGTIMGIDSEGDYMLDGTIHPGSSGSGVFTSDGQFVGVMRATYMPFPILPMTPLREVLSLLIARTSVRPIATFSIVPVIPPLPGLDRR